MYSTLSLVPVFVAGFVLGGLTTYALLSGLLRGRINFTFIGTDAWEVVRSVYDKRIALVIERLFDD